MRTPLLAAVLLSACAHLDADAVRRSLLQADQDFAREVAARGVEAWAEAFADDGAMLVANGPMVRGRERIREVMADLGDPRKSPPQLILRWRPLGAQVSADGTLGFTWGNSVSVSPQGERQSKYLTVWKRDAGGRWKVAVDQGSPGWADPSSPP